MGWAGVGAQRTQRCCLVALCSRRGHAWCQHRGEPQTLGCCGCGWDDSWPALWPHALGCCSRRRRCGWKAVCGLCTHSDAIAVCCRVRKLAGLHLGFVADPPAAAAAAATTAAASDTTAVMHHDGDQLPGPGLLARCCVVWDLRVAFCCCCCCLRHPRRAAGTAAAVHAADSAGGAAAGGP